METDERTRNRGPEPLGEILKRYEPLRRLLAPLGELPGDRDEAQPRSAKEREAQRTLF